MNNIRKNIKNIAVATLVGASFAGCSLDLLPLNEVVLENFWTDKNDVASVVASCYEGMASSGYVTDLIVWGENRSDNIVAGPQADGALWPPGRTGRICCCHHPVILDWRIKL